MKKIRVTWEELSTHEQEFDVPDDFAVEPHEEGYDLSNALASLVDERGDGFQGLERTVIDVTEL